MGRKNKSKSGNTETKKLLSTVKKTAHKVTNMYNNSKLSVLIMNGNTLNSIFDICLDTAKGSEFQVHYRSLTFECTNKQTEAILFITIPTVFYNMPQEVTTAHIDFHTDEIYENGEAVKPLSIAYAQKDEIAQINKILNDRFDKVTISEIPDNSLHRHPSRSTFSSTDYDDDPDEPGVIYRKGVCNELIQTDSVMYKGNEGELVVTESRIATVSKADDGTVTAKYVEIPTKVYLHKVKQTNLMKLFGQNPEVTTKIMDSDLSDMDYPMLNDIVQDIITVLPEPTLDFIDPENITQKKWRTTTTNTTYKTTTKIPTSFTQDEIDTAGEYGYDILLNKNDAEEWNEYREYFYAR